MSKAIVPAQSRELATPLWPQQLGSLLADPKPIDGRGRTWRLQEEHLDVPMTPAELEAVAEATHRAMQEPATPKAIAVLLTRLWVHYKAVDLSDRESEWLWQDTIDDLTDFPAPAISAACVYWRRNEKWRPTIAELREICTLKKREIYRQIDRAFYIAGAKRAGWDVIVALRQESYLSEEAGAQLLCMSWTLERERFTEVCHLAGQLPPPSEPYRHNDPAREAFRSAVSELRQSIR